MTKYIVFERLKNEKFKNIKYFNDKILGRKDYISRFKGKKTVKNKTVGYSTVEGFFKMYPKLKRRRGVF